MRTLPHAFAPAIAIALFLVIGPLASAQDDKSQQDQQAQAQTAAAKMQAQTQQQANPQIEQQRKEAQQQAQKSLDPDAVAAIGDTRAAINALEKGDAQAALQAIERASGKVNVLVGRNPANALIPAAFEVVVIDAAPRDVKEIKRIAKAADKAIDDKDYPAARVLLANLVSELRERTYHIPLATYPIAMRDAAQLIEQKKYDEAKAELEVALNTLLVVDRVRPLPIVSAQVAVDTAQQIRDQDKEKAKQLLATARAELDRARALGYAGMDPEYDALASAISDVEKEINGGKDSKSAFQRLKEKLASFFHRQSQSEKRSEVASR